MDNLVLLCKSYIGDIERAAMLIESVTKHNVDRLPFYVSVPSGEHAAFYNRFRDSVTLIVDEAIVNKTYNSNWATQQIVKSEFWRLELCNNYLMVDSDSYFIKDFKEEDFIYEGSTPYTVMHEQKDLWQYVSRKCEHNPIFKYHHGKDQEGFREMRKVVQKEFDRPGRAFDFGPGPVVWSCDVWKSLYTNYTQVKGGSFEQLIKTVPSEFTWYGEWLLKHRTIPIIPIEPPFKFFHHKEQYLDALESGETEDTLRENFFGIVMQSNWTAPYKFGEGI